MTGPDVANVPNSEVVPLFNHLVGTGEQRRRHVEAERLGGLEIDDQLEPSRLLDRQVGRLGAFENLGCPLLETGQFCPGRQRHDASVRHSGVIRLVPVTEVLRLTMLATKWVDNDTNHLWRFDRTTC
jgi:hypothetical protein